MTKNTLQSDLCEYWQYRCWSHPINGRRYWAELKQNLFGEWVLIQRWGSKYSRHGGSLETLYPDYEAGLSQLMAVAKRRQQRGYIAQ